MARIYDNLRRELVTVNRAAEILGKAVTTIRWLAEEKKLTKVIPTGSRRMFLVTLESVAKYKRFLEITK